MNLRKESHPFYRGLFALMLCAFAVTARTAQAAEVRGPQSGRWAVTSSPYIVTGDIIVPAGTTLTIEPGVVVQFAGYYTMKIEGTLIATGNTVDRIVFTSVNDKDYGAGAGTPSPSVRDWRGIEFSASAANSTMQYCLVRFSDIVLSAPAAAPGLKRILIASTRSKTINLKGKMVAIFEGQEQDYTEDAAATAATSAEVEEEFSFGEITVVTVSKREQKVTEAPAAVYVVTDQMIQDRGYRNLEEVLEDLPGVEIQRKSVAEFSNYISFRGIAGNEKFIVLQDGVRANAADGTPHVVGVNYGLANVHRVEVVLGPASALYGVDAFSGVVNIITKTGEQIDGAEISGSFGNFSTTDNSLVWGKKLDQMSVSVSGQRYHSGEPNFADTYRNDYQWYNNQYQRTGNVQLSPFLPHILVQTPIVPYETPTDAYTVNAKIKVYDFEIAYMRNYEAHNNSVGNKPEFNLYSKEALYGTRLESAFARHNFTSLNEKWSVQSALSRNAYSLDPDSKFLNTFSGYRPAYKYASSKSTKLEEQISYYPSAKTSLIAGFSYEDIASLPKTGDLPVKFDENEAADAQNVIYIGTNLQDKSGKSLAITQNFFSLEYKNYGSYVQLQTQAGKSLGLTLGGRYDHNTRYGSSVNPRAGLVLTPNEKVNFKLLYGEAFLAPSPYKAYQHYGSFIPTTDSAGAVTGLFGPFWHLPNPDLKPEKLRSYEGSFSFYASSNVVFAVDGYFTRINDLIVNGGEPNLVFEGVPVGFAEFAVNKGTAEIKGGTVRVETVSKTNEVTINSRLAYSLTNGNIDGETLAFSAKHTLKAGLDVKYRRFALAPRMVFRSKSLHPNAVDAQGQRMSSDAFTVLNLFARYTFTASSSPFEAAAFVRLNNLTNAKYYNVSFAGAEGFAATPQDPRRITGGVNVKF